MIKKLWSYSNVVIEFCCTPHGQVASMISDVSSALEECVKSVSYPEELKTLMAYQKDLSQLDDNGNHIIC